MQDEPRVLRNLVFRLFLFLVSPSLMVWRHVAESLRKPRSSRWVSKINPKIGFLLHGRPHLLSHTPVQDWWRNRGWRPLSPGFAVFRRSSVGRDKKGASVRASAAAGHLEDGFLRKVDWRGQMPEDEGVDPCK